MKTFYCVVSTFDDRGRTTAGITDTCQADVKPESTFRSTSRKDIYTDWFDSLKKAEAFVKEAREA